MYEEVSGAAGLWSPCGPTARRGLTKPEKSSVPVKSVCSLAESALSLTRQTADSTGTTPSFGASDLQSTGRGLPASAENFTPLRLVVTRLNSATTEGLS